MIFKPIESFPEKPIHFPPNVFQPGPSTDSISQEPIDLESESLSVPLSLSARIRCPPKIRPSLCFKSFSGSEEMKTGLIYHPEMDQHDAGISHLGMPNHIECSTRSLAILQHFDKFGLLDRCSIIFQFDPIDEKSIRIVHSPEYVKVVSKFWGKSKKEKEGHVLVDNDSYFTKNTNHVAKLALKASIIAVKRVMSKRWKNAFLPIRPPGHHAGTHQKITGFCIYNNVVMAAKFAQLQFGVKKILIFDWDVHHGDSTQKLTYKDPGIMFVSIHRRDHGQFYPRGPGSMKELGERLAFGTNINFPWNTRAGYKIGDNEYVRTKDFSAHS